jgi:mono/diheme cytochrome c family protein
MKPIVSHTVRLCVLGLLVSCSISGSAISQQPDAGADRVVVPKIWDAEKLATWATPVAGVNLSPNFYSEKEYYAAPVDSLRTYPVYHPDHEPEGYRSWLAAVGPKPLIEPVKLQTKADWLAAGERVFVELDIPEFRTDDPRALEWTRNSEAITADKAAVTKDGILPLYRWVVEQDGGVKLSFANCAACHQRLLPNGTLLRGAPSNLLDHSAASNALVSASYRFRPHLDDSTGPGAYVRWGVPWLKDDIHAPCKTMTDDELDAALDGPDSPRESFDRFNGSPYYKNKMADLIGVKNRKYLDATATHVNRGPEDIARYGALVVYADDGSYGPYQVMSDDERKLKFRFSDEALYALGLYIYSLEPLKSPHPFDDLAKRGQQVFESEGCIKCHTPPHYTNNKLVAATGFKPNYDDPVTKRLDISKRRVGTDPGLALRTRKGTGYYKIPSLRGLWYRGLYEHCGSVSSLEDWFDPKRLRDDYRPTGWAGPGSGTRAVPGHRFGHDLLDEDKRALIAFLRTL